jgi:hypothetical protein
MGAARAFDRLFSSAERLGQHPTPDGAPYAGYFKLLASMGSFFENMARKLRPEERWRPAEGDRARDRDALLTLGCD